MVKFYSKFQISLKMSKSLKMSNVIENFKFNSSQVQMNFFKKLTQNDKLFDKLCTKCEFLSKSKIIIRI